MIITMVVDQYGSENNGTTMSTRRFAKALAERGHEVRVLGVTKNNPAGKEKLFDVPERNAFLATYFAHKQGLLFAKIDKDVINEALQGTDIVHVLMPFKFEKAVMLQAQKQGIPVTGAFHVQAENVTTQLGLANFDWANKLVYKYFNDNFYKHLNYIHCPSEMIAGELKDNGYKANLFVISNGIQNYKKADVTRPYKYRHKFVILTIGRLSKEKRHDVLIEAIKKSKYCNDIQLIIAGRGPLLEETKKLGSTLPQKPVIDFFTQKHLSQIIGFTDLYVHPADVEIEAISCVEAFNCGIVPVIGNNQKSATKQFALDPMCLFEHGNSDDLAKKIDYFIEHPEFKNELSKKYIEYGKEFSIDRSIDKIEDMFIRAIKENK